MYLQSLMLTANVLDDAEIEDFCPFRADDVDVESEEEESSDCYDSRLGVISTLHPLTPPSPLHLHDNERKIKARGVRS